MGNSLGGSKKAKVMKVDGATFKLKTPARAGDVVKDYPGHVLMDSAAVEARGLRAKPLEPGEELKPKRVYFLVHLPRPVPEIASDRAPRRVRSTGVRMGAKERLDLLMLSRRTASDMTAVRKPSSSSSSSGDAAATTPVSVRMRLPKSQVERMVSECKDQAEVAEKIVNLYMSSANRSGGGEEVEGEADTGGECGRVQRARVLGSIRERTESKKMGVHVSFR